MGRASTRVGRTGGQSRWLRPVALTVAALTGFGGAAAVDALTGPAIAEAADFGPGDALTRYVVTAAAGGDAMSSFVAALDRADGVVSAQPLFDDTALVAVDGLAPDALRALPGVAAVELSPRVPVMGFTDDPYATEYGWNLENDGRNVYLQTASADADADALDGWASSTGAGRVVAVIDTGFDHDHPDLAGSLWKNPGQECDASDTDGNGLVGDCHGWNFHTNSADLDNGAQGTHGASVAGVVGARRNNGVGSAGIAPEVSLMPLVIGGGESVDVNLGAKAIRYAVDHGADVINASWGGEFTGSALDNLKSAVAYAAAHDVLIVAAAGNDGLDRDSRILYPASLPDANIITVGSSNAVDGVSDTSAFGATTVDLFAPGNKVATTWNDGSYRLVSGTSIAAPHVAAAVALYRSAHPDDTAAQSKARLLADTDKIPTFAGRSVSGGRLTLSKLPPAVRTSVDFTFSSMTTAPGTVHPRIDVRAPSGTGSYAVTLGLGMEQAGEVWALADTDVSLGGATARTDDAGQVTFPLGTLATVDGHSLTPTMDLTQGRYALTVQLVKDGAPAGSTYAAPLLVGDAQQPGGGTGPGTTPPGTTTPGTPDPGTTTPGTPGPGTTTPGTTTPGTPDPGTTDPGTTTPGTPAPGTTDPAEPTAPGTTDPVEPTDPGTTDPVEPTDQVEPGPTGPTDPDPGTTDPADPAEPTDPGTTDPGTTDPADPADPAPGSTDPGTPGPGTDPVTPAPAPAPAPAPEVVTYPEIGPFGITSISPAVVSTAGGTRVTITGTDLPDGARVRVGDSRAATVVSSNATTIVLTAPAAVAGVYDVTVFNASGTVSSTLDDGLTYTADSDPGSTPTPDDEDPAPGEGTDPGTTEPSDGPAGPVVATGPDGQRLVRSAVFGALRSSFWSQDCSTSCRGLRL